MAPNGRGLCGCLQGNRSFDLGVDPLRFRDTARKGSPPRALASTAIFSGALVRLLRNAGARASRPRWPCGNRRKTPREIHSRFPKSRISLAPRTTQERGKIRQRHRKPFTGTLWVRIPPGTGWPPAGSESCVAEGNDGTRRRQRVQKRCDGAPKPGYCGGGLRCEKDGDGSGGAERAWRSRTRRGLRAAQMHVRVPWELGRSRSLPRRDEQRADGTRVGATEVRPRGCVRRRAETRPGARAEGVRIGEGNGADGMGDGKS